MAKPLVLLTGDGVTVPFLRGILTRALQDAGLDFDEAYRLSSEIRDDLRDAGEVTSAELRERVEQKLQPYGQIALHRYRTRLAAPPPIWVTYPDGHRSPFSRGRQRQALSPCGIGQEASARVVERILETMAVDGITEISTYDLGFLTYRLLEQEVGDEAAHRYAVWEEFSRSDVPLLVLVGGATGTGKSTVTALISNRLEIVRAQSTDMLREVMRMMVPERLLPVLHRSSFQAWEALPQREREGEETDTLLADGYRTQVELLSVACEAVFQRSVTERVSLVMEGVHVHPVLLDRIPRNGGVIVVPVMLAVLDPDRLRQHIRGRGKQAPGRRAKRYLKHFDEIWRLQSYLLSEADRAGVPIVTNDEVDDVLDAVVGIVMRELAKHFAGKPTKVFR